MGQILNRRRVMGSKAANPFIQFADPAVKAICVEQWGGADGGIADARDRVNNTKVQGVAGEITYEQAASVVSVRKQFKNNTDIKYFDEFRFFTGVTVLPWYSAAFAGVNMELLTWPENIVSVGDNTTQNATIKHLHVLGNKPKDYSSFSIRRANIQNVYYDDINVIYDSVNAGGIEGSLNYNADHIYINGVDTHYFTIPEAKPLNNCQLASKAVYGIILPSTQTTIPESAFRNTQMQTLTIPSGVTSLGNYILYGTALPEIIFTSIVPPTATSSTWSGNQVGVIYVPDGSVDAYKAADNWSGVASKIKSINERP